MENKKELHVSNIPNSHQMKTGRYRMIDELKNKLGKTLSSTDIKVFEEIELSYLEIIFKLRFSNSEIKLLEEKWAREKVWQRKPYLPERI